MKFAIAAFALAAIAASTASEAAGLARLSGVWHQIASNAGDCTACRIEIDGDGPASTVTANNGWQADVREVPAATSKVAGFGRWASSVKGWPAGRSSEATFQLIGDRLFMTMIVDGAPRRVVKGIFERREWVGM